MGAVAGGDGLAEGHPSPPWCRSCALGLRGHRADGQDEAGLRQGQQLGDNVLAHGYVREDHVLDEELPLWVTIPPLAEIQQPLEQAVADVPAQP